MKKILTISVVVLLVFALSGCASQETMKTAITSDGGGLFYWILVKPISYILNFFTDGIGNSFAWGIFFTTIFVRTVAWPIYAKSNDFTMKMQMMQPELNRLQAKYAGRKDPESLQKMRVEQSKIWKKHGASPAGCIVPFLQMPLFYAMFQVVRRYPIAGEAGDTPSAFAIVQNGAINKGLFGLDMTKGVSIDFSNFFATAFNTATLQYWILPIFVGITMFFLQKVSQKKPDYAKNIPAATPNAQAEQSQKMMKYVMNIMIIMMVFISLSITALAFYWFIGNLYAIGQNLVNRKLNKKKFLRLKEQSNIIG